MAIKKIKKTESDDKRVGEAHISPSPDLETKRVAFQQAVTGTKTIGTTLPKHHSPRKRTLIIIVGALLAIIGTVVAVYAYFWYQSPSKVVLDSVLNAVNASSVSYTGTVVPDGASAPDVTFKGGMKDGTTQVDANIKTAFSGEAENLNASVITTKSDTYVKIDKASELLRQLAPAKQKKLYEQAASTVKKQVDGKWLSLRPDELGTVSSFTNISTCSTESLRNVGANKEISKELAALYVRHNFMNIEETSSEGVNGTYMLSINKDKLSAFASALSDLKTVPKALSICMADMQKAHSSVIDTIRVQLSINKADRVITGITVATGPSLKMTIKATATFNQHPAIALPPKPVKFQDVQADIFREYVNSTFQMMNSGLSSVIMGS